MLPKLKLQNATQNGLPFQKNSINLNCVDSYQDNGQNYLFDSSKSSIWNARNISQKIINETKDTKILKLKNTPLRPRTRQNLGNLNQHIKQRSANKIQNKQNLDKSFAIQQKINLSILEQDSQLADNQNRQQRKQQSLTPFGEPFNFKSSYLKQSPLQSNVGQDLINQSFIYDPVYSFYAQSKIGKVKNQKKKENQDSHCELADFGNVKFNYLFSVMDGHGNFGHQVSQFTKKWLPQILMHYTENIKEGINQLQKHIEQKMGELVQLSGTTCCCILIQKVLNQAQVQKVEHEDMNTEVTQFMKQQSNQLINGSKSQANQQSQENKNSQNQFCFQIICVNVGDSRAILGIMQDQRWFPLPLSIDHNPFNLVERQRIITAGGRIDERVWLKNQDIPGLAMTRSLGDTVGRKAGIISEPSIYLTQFAPESQKFLIVASDGLWHSLTNEKVVKLVSKFWILKDAKGACQKLIKEARTCENKEFVDDITVIVVFFNQL